MRVLPALIAVLFLLVAPSAKAQVLYVHFKSEKATKQFAEHLTTFHGEPALIGEPKEGITINGGTISFTTGGDAKNVFFIGDPARPQFVPYEKKENQKVTAKGGKVVAIPGDAIARIGYVDQYLTLEGIAIEFGRRDDEVKSLREARDTNKKGDRAWFAEHGRLLAKIDGLATWLTEMGYVAAAKKWKSDLDRERKVVSKEATAVREKAALASIKAVPAPEHLVEVAQKIGGSKMKFNMRESMHGRILYPTSISDAAVEHGLQLIEQMVEGFRKQFVDPYLDDDYPDYIQDEIFAEFFFTPDDDKSYEQYWTDYYGYSWGTEHKEERLKTGATFGTAGKKIYLSYSKQRTDGDLEGMIAHALGHFLADVHYDASYHSDNLDWLQEAVGYYLSFEYLGRNSVTCFDYGKSDYAKQAEKDGKKTVQSGQKGNFNEVALALGPTIDQLFIKKLFQFTDADLAKSWSFYDFVAKKLGKPGQIWLRTVCFAVMRGKTGFLERERGTAEKLFEVPHGEDVYQALEERWKKFAKSGQMR